MKLSYKFIVIVLIIVNVEEIVGKPIRYGGIGRVGGFGGVGRGIIISEIF